MDLLMFGYSSKTNTSDALFLDDIQNRCVVNVCILYILNISQFAFLE